MKKILFLSLILLSYSTLYAQQKFKEYVDGRKIAEFSLFPFKYSSLKIPSIEMSRIQIPILKNTTFEFSAVSLNGLVDKDDDDPSSIISYVPFGIRFYLKSKPPHLFSLYSKIYLFNKIEYHYEEHNTVKGSYPKFFDFGISYSPIFKPNKKMAISERAYVNMFEFFLGFCYQPENFRFTQTYYERIPLGGNSYNEVRKTREHEKNFFKSFYVGVSFNLLSTFFNNAKTKRIHLPNPKLEVLDINVEFDSNDINSQYLAVKLKNSGKGFAEKVAIYVRPERNSFMFWSKKEKFVGNILPRETKEIKFPVKIKKDYFNEQIKLEINVTEKDGFNIDKFKSVNFATIKKEKFPPVLTADARLIEPNGNSLLDANEKAEIELTISNNGKGSAWNLEVILAPKTKPQTSRHLFIEKYHKIIRIRPHSSKKIRIPIRADALIPNDKVRIGISVREANGFDISPVNISFGTQAFLAPKLEIVDVGIDDSQGENSYGNGDNIIQNNETIEVTVLVQNRGEGNAKGVRAKVNVMAPTIFYSGENEYYLGKIVSGDFKVIKFNFVVNNRYSGNSNLPISMLVNESSGKYGISKNLGLVLNKINIAAKDIEIEGQYHKSKKIVKAPDIAIDIEKEIPKTTMYNPNALAVVIGNKNYQNTKNVLYAIRDAQLMKQYLKNTLGFKEGNIFLLLDATKADFELYFGIDRNPKGKLYNSLKRNQSDIFIYYSGHGAPSIQSKKGFFVPVDCDPQYVDINGYSLDLFYKNLSKLQARSITVVLDACFSGINIFENISPISIKIDNPVVYIPKSIIMTSSKKEQVSSWYNEKKHGMFTYFFLKAIHNYNADFNNDRQISFKEIYQYLSDENDGVPYYARRLHGIEQNPVLYGLNKDRVFIKF